VLQLTVDNGYESLHKLMLKQALRRPGKLVSAEAGSEAHDLAKQLGLIGAFAMVPGGGRASGPTAAAFIDVFSKDQRPQSRKNVAMLYVVGPKGGDAGGHGPSIRTVPAFLASVSLTASNSLRAVAKYNSDFAGDDLPTIDTVQWCLVSGGIYRPTGTTKKDVAVATVKGMQKAMKSGGSVVPKVRFSYDDGAFEAAVKSLGA